jgi:pimeloyl-ACP methyl ester carboxylesterase
MDALAAAKQSEPSTHAPPTTDLYVEVVGDLRAAAPPALFIHDFMTDVRLFDGILQPQSPLLQRANCVRFDLRGFGSSPEPTGCYNRSEDVAAVHALAGPPQPAHLVGAGLGGGVALEYALAFPDAVASVCLVSSGLPGHAWKRAMRAYFRLPLLDDVKPPAGLSEERLAAKELCRAWVEQSPEWQEALGRGDGVSEMLLDMYRRYSCFHFWGDDMLSPDPFEEEMPLSVRIKDVQAPVLVMVGEHESVGDTADFRLIGEEIISTVPLPAYGKREVNTLRGAGHFGTLEAPLECEKCIANFWASLELCA